MRRLRAWWYRAVGLFSARRGREFDAELESHLELHIEDNLRRGMSPEEARRQALVALGGRQPTREAYRDRSGIPAIASIAQDVRFAGRMLRKAPAFTAAAILILAIGVGANAAVFSLINAALLRPAIPGMRHDALVGVYAGDRTRPDFFRLFSSMIERVRQSIRDVDERLPVVAMRTFEQHRDESMSLWGTIFAARLFTGFGMIALVLASVGVYGLRAYLVMRRTREIGIRVALGATRTGIVAELLREGTRTAAAGMLAGLVIAIGLVGILRSSGMLLDVDIVDPLVFGGAALVLAAATAAASYLPARRALRVDPAVALRPE
jgi:hypothetical protein